MCEDIVPARLSLPENVRENFDLTPSCPTNNPCLSRLPERKERSRRCGMLTEAVFRREWLFNYKSVLRDRAGTFVSLIGLEDGIESKAGYGRNFASPY